MKLTASRIERMLEKIEALAPPPQKWKWPGPPGRLLHAIVHEGDDEAETKKRTLEAQEKALAEHIAAHPEHAGSTVRDFFWIMHVIVDGKWEERDGTLKWVREDGTVVSTLATTIPPQRTRIWRLGCEHACDNYSAAEDPDMAAKADDLDPPPDLQPPLAVSTAETAEAAQIPSPAVPPARSRPYQQSRRVVRSWLAD
jgi:hypothetical protein